MLKKIEKSLGIDAKYFLSGGFWLSLSNSFNTLRALFIGVIFARLLSQDQLGAYFYILSIFYLTNIFGMPGMGTAILQSSARGFEGSYKYLSKRVFFWSFLGTIFLLGFSFYDKVFKGGNYFNAFFLLALIFPLYSASTNFVYYLVGKSQFKLRMKMETLANITSFLAIIFVLLEKGGVFSLIMVTVISQTIFCLSFTIYLIKKANNLIDPKAEKYGKSLSYTYIMPTIKMQADKIIVTNFLGYSSNAIYSISTAIADQVYALAKIVGTIIMPRSAKLSYAQIQSGFKKKMMVVFLSFLFICVIIFIIAPFAVKVLFGEKYLSSVGYLRLIIIFIPIRCLSAIIKNIHESRKNIKILSISSNYISALEFFLMMPGIYFFQIWGIIIAKIISDSVNLIFQVYYIYSKKNDILSSGL